MLYLLVSLRSSFESANSIASSESRFRDGTSVSSSPSYFDVIFALTTTQPFDKMLMGITNGPEGKIYS